MREIEQTPVPNRSAALAAILCRVSYEGSSLGSGSDSDDAAVDALDDDDADESLEDVELVLPVESRSWVRGARVIIPRLSTDR